MPFTLAHPAAVIPLAKPLGRYAVLSALIIGSMMPDVSYLLSLDIDREYSHSLVGLFGFCVPIGLLVYWVFHLLYKGPLIAMCGTALQSRCPEIIANYKQLPKVPLFVVIGSLWIGAVTHLVWDAFTHAGSFFVAEYPILQHLLFSFHGVYVPVYRLLQQLSSVMGLVLMAYWVRQWYINAEVHAIPANVRLGFRHRAWVCWLIVVCAIMAGLLTGLEDMLVYQPSRWMHVIPKDMVLAAMPVGLACFTLSCVLWHLGWLKSNTSKEPTTKAPTKNLNKKKR